jgi:cytochrome P450
MVILKLLYRERAFSGKAIEEYNPLIELHTTKMVEILAKPKQNEVEVVEMFGNMTFDLWAILPNPEIGFGG